MKKKNLGEYGEPLLLYPGLSLRIGSMMQICPAFKKPKKETVDKFVDSPAHTRINPKNRYNRPDCPKNRQ